MPLIMAYLVSKTASSDMGDKYSITIIMAYIPYDEGMFIE